MCIRIYIYIYTYIADLRRPRRSSGPSNEGSSGSPSASYLVDITYHSIMQCNIILYYMILHYIILYHSIV